MHPARGRHRDHPGLRGHVGSQVRRPGRVHRGTAHRRARAGTALVDLRRRAAAAADRGRAKRRLHRARHRGVCAGPRAEVALHADGVGRRRGLRRHRARDDSRGPDDHPQGDGPADLEGQDQVDRRRWRLHHRRRDRDARRRHGTQDGAEVAGPSGAPLPAQTGSDDAVHDGHAHPRHVLPDRPGRQRHHSGRLRHGQDGHAAVARQVGRRRHHLLHRLRRAR